MLPTSLISLTAWGADGRQGEGALVALRVPTHLAGRVLVPGGAGYAGYPEFGRSHGLRVVPPRQGRAGVTPT